MRERTATTRPDWLTRELFPFESRFVEVDGHVVHYVDEGSGPTLLMLHGNPTWSFLYRHLIARLHDRFRCVALDYPGFGLSTAAPGYDHLPESHEEVLHRFVDRLALERFVPVVQDWGGPIGLGLAGQRPERVAGLVIGNTWAWPVGDDPHFRRFSGVMGGAVGGFAIRRFNAFVNLLIPLGTRRRKLSRAEMAAYRRPLDTPRRREASHVFPREIVGSAAFLARVEAGLARLKDTPALICWGDADFAFRAKERARFEARFADSTTVVLRGASHYIQEDAPEDLAKAIRDWASGRELS
jgi:haloalkane dehalogenase